MWAYGWLIIPARRSGNCLPTAINTVWDKLAPGSYFLLLYLADGSIDGKEADKIVAALDKKPIIIFMYLFHLKNVHNEPSIIYKECSASSALDYRWLKKRRWLPWKTAGVNKLPQWKGFNPLDFFSPNPAAIAQAHAGRAF